MAARTVGRSAARLWFGRLLRWREDGGQWWAAHDGRPVRLVHVDRSRDGWRRGWYLERDPGAAGDGGPVGPYLAGRLADARMLAELRAVTAATDREPAELAPSLLVAAGGGGAVCATPAGTQLTVYPDQPAARFTVHVDRPGGGRVLVGTVRPRFDVPANPDLYPVAVTWLAEPVGPATGRGLGVLAPATGWHTAVAELGAELDRLDVAGLVDQVLVDQVLVDQVLVNGPAGEASR